MCFKKKCDDGRGATVYTQAGQGIIPLGQPALAWTGKQVFSLCHWGFPLDAACTVKPPKRAKNAGGTL